MASEQQWIRRTLLDFKLARAFNEPFLRFSAVPLFAWYPVSISSERISFRHPGQKVGLAPARQSSKRAFTNFVALLVKLTRLEMFAHERNHLPAHVVTVERVNVDTSEEILSRRHARFLVPARAPASLKEFSRGRLPEIMGQRRQHHRHLPRVIQLVDQLPRAIDRQLRMYKNVTLRMPFRIRSEEHTPELPSLA